MKWKNINFNYRIFTIAIVLLLGLSFFVVTKGVDSVFASSGYTVSFDYNESSLSSNMAINQTMRDSIENYSMEFDGGYLTNSQIRKPSNLFNPYYTYQWTYNGQVVDIESINITKDITFKLKWTPVKYYVNFNFASEDIRSIVTNLVDRIEFTVESPRIELYEPNIPHYRFEGWYNGGVHYDLMYLPAGSIGTKNFTARITPVDYVIHYNTKASNANNPKYYSVTDEDIVLATPSQEGHIFKGWYLDNNYTTPITTIDCSQGGNIELYPLWELEVYTVTYIMPDGYTRKIDVEYGKKVDLPEIKKNIFEIVTTDISRNNITEDTTIKIKVVNIWYVYVLGILAVAGLVVAVVIVKKRREKTHDDLRNKYLAGTTRRPRATVSIIEKVPVSNKNKKDIAMYRSISVVEQTKTTPKKKTTTSSTKSSNSTIQKTKTTTKIDQYRLQNSKNKTMKK